MGSLTEMGAGYIAYRMSKAGINVVTRVLAAETQGMGILVNSVDPGWVQTDMGGRGATRTLYKGAETPVWLATVPDGGPTGGFFRDRVENLNDGVHRALRTACSHLLTSRGEPN